MLHQLPSYQRFARLARRDFEYYSLQQHRRKEHGAKQRKPNNTVADLNKIVEGEADNGEKLKEDLSACQHLLVDTEMDNGRDIRCLTFKCQS